MNAIIPVRQIPSAREEPIFSGSFIIREVKDLLDGKDMFQELHRHDFYFVLVLVKGKGKHEIDFSSYDITNHSISFMRPGQVHRLSLKAGSTGYLVQFKNEFYLSDNKTLNKILRNASSKNFCIYDSDKFKKILAVLTNIFQEYSGKQEVYKEIIKANLSILFIELIRHRQNIEVTLNSTNQYKQERIEEFLELLELHISECKQVLQYAQMMNLSPYQLNAITKAALGKTCSEIINEYIILESKRYLLAASDQVNQIAYHLGYDDVSYFIRFFKKHTGHSPEVFRNNYK